MKELEVLLFVAIVAMGLLLIILLQKITILKKQTDDIIKEVKAYVSYITEDEQIPRQESPNEGKIRKVVNKDEAQNNIIQAVLGEYFP